MGSLSVKAAVCTDIGLNRTNNEDNYYLSGKYLTAEDDGCSHVAVEHAAPQGVFAVFDGMGGQSRGEFASYWAAKTLNRYKDRILRDGAKKVYDYVQDANDKICKEMEKSGERIGSTAVILAAENGKARVYNLGDSRAYYIHKGQIQQLSKDHTVADQLFQLNMLTKEEAMRDLRRHKLTKHLGIFPSEMKLRPYISSSIKLENGDLFILCSDGVTNSLTDQELNRLAKRYGEKYKTLATAIVEKALENKSDDNITAMVVKVVNNVYHKNRRKWGRHPRMYPFLLGVGVSAIVFGIIVALMLAHFMG